MSSVLALVPYVFKDDLEHLMLLGAEITGLRHRAWFMWCGGLEPNLLCDRQAHSPNRATSEQLDIPGSWQVNLRDIKISQTRHSEYLRESWSCLD